MMTFSTTSSLRNRNLRLKSLPLAGYFARKNSCRAVGNINNSESSTTLSSSSLSSYSKTCMGSSSQIEYQKHYFTSRSFINPKTTNDTNEDHNKKSYRYGTQTVVESVSKCHHPPNHPLTPYIKNMILDSTNNHQNEHQPQQQDSSFNITFLGTSGAGRPTHTRNQSSTCLKINGKLFIFDAGEGTQKQISFVSRHIHLLDTYKIFITHLHIDHVGGLTTLILNARFCDYAQCD